MFIRKIVLLQNVLFLRKGIIFYLADISVLLLWSARCAQSLKNWICVKHSFSTSSSHFYRMLANEKMYTYISISKTFSTT